MSSYSLSDVLFKYLFGDEKYKQPLKSLVQAFLRESFDDFVFLNTEVAKSNVNEKSSRFDLFIETTESNKTKRVNIEAQNMNLDELWSRLLYYWTRAYTAHFSIGDKYGKLKESVVLVFLNDIIDDSDIAVRYFSIMEESLPHMRPTNHFRIVFVELQKFSRGKVDYDFSDERHQWAHFFVNLVNNTKALEEVAKMHGNPAIQSALDRYVNLTDEQKEYIRTMEGYRRSDINTAAAAAAEEAERKMLVEHVLSMYQKGMPAKEIAHYLDLRLDEVKGILSQ